MFPAEKGTPEQKVWKDKRNRLGLAPQVAIGFSCETREGVNSNGRPVHTNKGDVIG